MKRICTYLSELLDSQSKRMQLAYVLVSFVWFLIALNLPYYGDDLVWGSPDGVTEWLTARTNSRYVGNGIEIVMTRSRFLKTLILTVVYSLIPILTAKIVRRVTYAGENQSTLPYLMANALIFGINTLVWRQTYGWIAGAANFVISYLFVLIYILVVLDDGRKNSQSFRIWHGMGCILLGIIMQLFIENLAIAMVGISIAVVVYTRFYRKKPGYAALSLLLGNVIGVGIMFSSSMYKTLFQTGNAVGGYRALSFSTDASLISVVKNSTIYLISGIVPTIYQEYAMPVTIVIVLLLVFLLIRQEKRRGACICVAGLSVAVTGYMVGTVYGILPVLFSGTRYKYLLHNLLASGGLFLLVSIGLILVLSQRRHSEQLVVALGAWIAAPAVVAPLCVTTELGARLFVTPLLLLVIVATILAQAAIACMGRNGRRMCTAMAAAAVLLLSAKWTYIYYTTGAETAAHMEQFAQAAPGHTVYVKPYTYRRYMNISTSRVVANENFLRFYNLPEDVTVILEADK